MVIVPDYAAGGPKTRNDLRGLFKALAKQEYEGQVGFFLCENANLKEKIPLDFIDLLPG